MILLDAEGTVLRVNEAFTNNYGYENNEIKGLHFKTLFTERDREIEKPEKEILNVLTTGNALDENYVVHRNGREIWSTGESVLVIDTNGEKFILKDVVNLETTKQLQFFLVETEEILERLFESSEDAAIIILDAGMKIIKANQPFQKLFEIKILPGAGSRLADLGNAFWSTEEIHQLIRKLIVNNKPVKQLKFTFTTNSGETKEIGFDGKVLDPDPGNGKKVVLMLRDLGSK
jgi:PAS domain S-box-containing protein